MILQKSDDDKSILITCYYNPEKQPEDFVSFYKQLLDHDNSKIRRNIISRIYEYIDLNITFNIAFKDKSSQVRYEAVSHLQKYNQEYQKKNFLWLPTCRSTGQPY